MLRKLKKILLFLLKSSITGKSGSKKKFPTVLQFPITNKCNCNCVMCNIRKNSFDQEVSFEQLALNLEKPIFSKIKAVGVNGGEPFSLVDIDKYLESIIKLPQLNYINIITNGILTDKIVSKLANIYEKCRERSIKLSVTVSLDGVGEVHDLVRGTPGAFDKAISTIEILSSLKYCDNFDISCTVVKQNVNHLVELDEFIASKGWVIRYRLGTDIERIGSDLLHDDFSVLTNQRDIFTAREFFYSQIFAAKDLFLRFKYYGVFKYLENTSNKRIMGCLWQEDGITLDSKGNLYYCAVKSKQIGTIEKNGNLNEIYNRQNIKYRKELIKLNCSKCIHDYYGTPFLISVIKFFIFLNKERNWCVSYRKKV